MKKLHFASDNYAGVCPEVQDLLNNISTGYDSPYGADEWTTKSANLLRDFFEADCEVFFVFNGTAANSLALASICQPFHSVICAETAHIETDECGAPEFFSNGSKILLAKEKNGKIIPEDIERIINKRNDIHYPQAEAISITQPTELGTVYSIEELNKLKTIAEKYNLKIHVDGARFWNALASSKKTPAELTWKSGVDVLCFGGTKSGMSIGEAVIFFNKDLAKDFDYRCKQAGQLASKMRYISAQWSAMLENNLWNKYAKNANEKAQELAEKICKFKEIKLMFPVEANEVFVSMATELKDALLKSKYHFYSFIGVGGVRLVANWSTTSVQIDELVEEIQNTLTII